MVDFVALQYIWQATFEAKVASWDSHSGVEVNTQTEVIGTDRRLSFGLFKPDLMGT
jgi:hypothetical protein